MQAAIRKALFLFCIALAHSGFSFAQYVNPIDKLEDDYGHPEISGTVGITNFLGDLGGNRGIGRRFIKDYKFITAHPLFGVSVAYYPENWYKIKAGIDITKIEGADSLINNTGDQERWRYWRNLSFRSNIFEAYVGAEFYPLVLADQYHSMKKFTPFLGIGIGAFKFKPQAQLDGKWIDLKPLHLEGEGFKEYPKSKNYSLVQLYAPFSGGARYILNNRWSLSSGFIYHYAFTDYVDDVSNTYIDPSYFDKYLSPGDAAIAHKLYARSLRPEKVRPGIDRGHRDNDTYLTFFITISYKLPRIGPFYYGGM